jgi:sigma-54 dependent transcriptional regulator, acetoin dehydrogenase operon transcriptional activator AcoR
MSNVRPRHKSGPSEPEAFSALSHPTPGLGNRTEGSDTMLAWERFLTGEPFAQTPTRNFVVSSWLRSRDFNIDPTARAAPIVRDAGKLEELRYRHRELISAAQPVFQDAAGLLAGTRTILLLTTCEGVVLRAVGDHQTLDAGQLIHLTEGGDWRESVIGTNGIGTALATGRPAQVHAAEHFCEGIKSWTCAAAPVLRPDNGEVLGVVDISGPPSTYQRTNLTLAVSIARQIEMLLADRQTRERARLLEACLDHVTGSNTAGSLTIDREGCLIHRSGRVPHALSLGQRLPGLGVDLPIERWSERLPPGLRAEWFTPVTVAGQTIGALVIIPSRLRMGGGVVGRSTLVHSEADPARGSFAAIIGVSPAIVAAVARARRLADKRVTVLIEGESGVGKELFARAIHGDGAAPFIVYNCGLAARDLTATELFGHVKGAYTGATTEGRAGRFELAQGGTLCLDEIGEMPLDAQILLLRALEEGIVYRVGDTQPRRVDVRVLALTNRSLADEVEAGRFRRDLFYRIAVARLFVPPLRDRQDDIDLLTDHFNRQLVQRHGVLPLSFSPEVLEILRRHTWPGNVRELRNCIESLLLTASAPQVSTNELLDLLPPTETAIRRAGTKPPEGESLVEVERDVILTMVKRARGNLSEAARLLGISRSTLYRKMSRYELDCVQGLSGASSRH